MRISLKKLCWTIGIVVAVAAVLGAVAGVAYTWRAQSRLNGELAILRAMNQPLELKDLAQDPIAPEENAATWLAQARDALDAIEKVLDSLDEPDHDALNRGEITPAVRAAMEAVLLEHPGVLELVEKSAQCEDAKFELDLENGTDGFYEAFGRFAQPSRTAVSVLYYRACGKLRTVARTTHYARPSRCSASPDTTSVSPE